MNRERAMKAEKSCSLFSFTFIEFLIAITILSAMLLAALNKARGTAKRIFRANNLKQLFTKFIECKAGTILGRDNNNEWVPQP